MNVVEKEHWQILRLLTREGYACSAEEAALIVGRTASGIRNLVRRYNRHGPQALSDRRRGRAGRKAVLTETQRQQLVSAVRKDPSDGGLWTGPKVAGWVQEHAGKRVSNVTGWQYLRRLGFTLQVPRPRHSESATAAEKTVWKKMLAVTVQVLAVLHPDKDVETWFDDEARLGLKPTMRRRWSEKGERPIAPSDTRYQWLYVYAFVHPSEAIFLPVR